MHVNGVNHLNRVHDEHEGKKPKNNVTQSAAVLVSLAMQRADLDKLLDGRFCNCYR